MTGAQEINGEDQEGQGQEQQGGGNGEHQVNDDDRKAEQKYIKSVIKNNNLFTLLSGCITGRWPAWLASS